MTIVFGGCCWLVWATPVGAGVACAVCDAGVTAVVVELEAGVDPLASTKEALVFSSSFLSRSISNFDCKYLEWGLKIRATFSELFLL